MAIKALIRKIRSRKRKNIFKSVGSNTVIPDSCDVEGGKNIEFGDSVYIGPRCVFYSTKAHLLVGSHVMFGPEVMIITGDHRIDVEGKRLDEITDSMKMPENDKDVIIEDDVWIGARALILKGVTIHTGAVVAAGAVVLEDIPPNTVYYSKGKTRPRFQSPICPKQFIQ